MRENQMARHWKILLALDAYRRGLTVQELSEMTGHHIRTIYRDLDALDGAGLPITTLKSPEGTKYLFTENYRFNLKLTFSPMELMALNLITATHNSLEGTIFHDALKTVREKVEATLGKDHKKYSEAIQSMFQATFRPNLDYGRCRKLIEAVTTSLLERRVMKVAYWTPSRQKQTRRKIEPYRLWYVNGVLYIVAYCRMRRGVRTFKLDRVREFEMTDEHFEIPDDFNFSDYASKGFKVMGGEEEREVVVRVHPVLEPQMTEQTWHPTQRVEKLKDGWMRVRFRLGALDEIKTWVQGYAPYIIVEKPQALIDEVVESCKEVLDCYQ